MTIQTVIFSSSITHEHAKQECKFERERGKTLLNTATEILQTHILATSLLLGINSISTML